jgi:Uma2 family endonuclease
VTIMHDEPLVLRRRFTRDEYHRMAEAGVLREDDRVELLDGEVVVMSPIGGPHTACVKRLNRLLQRRVGDLAIVSVQDPVELDERSEPQPDVALLRPRDDFYEFVTAPRPEDVLLAIEVGDTSVKFDREVKAPLYARAGVAELWLVDLPASEVQVCRRPGEKGYCEVTVLRRGDTLSPAALPDVSIHVDEILGAGTIEA